MNDAVSMCVGKRIGDLCSPDSMPDRLEGTPLCISASSVSP